MNKKKIMHSIMASKDEVMNKELIRMLSSDKEINLLAYKQSLSQQGIKSPPWLLSGINSLKIFTLSEDEFSFNLFKHLLLKLPLPRWIGPNNTYRCSCKRVIDATKFPDHWASCGESYKMEKIRRHNYCVQNFAQFMKSVIEKKDDKITFISTEHAISLALKDTSLSGELVNTYRTNKAKKIIPDVMVTLDNLTMPKVLDIDYKKNDKSFLFDVKFTHTCSGEKDVRSLNLHIQNFSNQFGFHLNKRELWKIIKYKKALGAEVSSKRFSPIVFDMAGGLGKFTKTLFESKFERFPAIASRLRDDIQYSRSLSWFLRVNSMNVAKSNFAIYKEFLKNNDKSD